MDALALDFPRKVKKLDTSYLGDIYIYNMDGSDLKHRELRDHSLSFRLRRSRGKEKTYQRTYCANGDGNDKLPL